MATLSKKIDATAIGTIDLTNGIDNVSQVFIGITFYNSGAIATPTDGTYTIEIQLVGMDNYLGVIYGEDVPAVEESPLLSYSGNAKALRYTPSGITGVDQIEITFIGES